MRRQHADLPIGQLFLNYCCLLVLWLSRSFGLAPSSTRACFPNFKLIQFIRFLHYFSFELSFDFNFQFAPQAAGIRSSGGCPGAPPAGTPESYSILIDFIVFDSIGRPSPRLRNYWPLIINYYLFSLFKMLGH